MARILVFKIRPSQEVLKIRDGTPLKVEGILTYRKRPSKLLGLKF
ncbi:Dnae2p [Orobanche minor]